MSYVASHILMLVNQVVSDVQKNTYEMVSKPNKETQDEFWTNVLYTSAILFRCLNNAFFVDKPISKIYRLDRFDSGNVHGFTVYGVPMPSTDPYRNYDFLVLDGSGNDASCATIPILKSDIVKVWHVFRSVA